MDGQTAISIIFKVLTGVLGPIGHRLIHNFQRDRRHVTSWFIVGFSTNRLALSAVCRVAGRNVYRSRTNASVCSRMRLRGPDRTGLSKRKAESGKQRRDAASHKRTRRLWVATHILHTNALPIPPDDEAECLLDGSGRVV